MYHIQVNNVNPKQFDATQCKHLLTYLTAHIPHLLRVVVGRVRSEAARINPAQLLHVVLHKLCA